MSAGGTWLGTSKQGKFAALTNFRDPSLKVNNPISRGKLVSNFLASNQSPEAFLKSIASQGDKYEGFNLLVGQRDSLWYYSNQNSQPPFQLSPGIYGLSNHLLDTPWPKVEDGKADFTKTITHEEANDGSLEEALFHVMNDKAPASDNRLPSTGVGVEVERYLSPRFILTPVGHYGTRCSTVLLLNQTGEINVHERTWENTGKMVETVSISATT